MSWLTILSLFSAGCVAGVWNAIAGGATFITFPVLMWTGLSPAVANASNFVALLPGNAAALPAYKSELRQLGNSIWPAVLIAITGGVIGSILLVLSKQAIFATLVPYLLLFATLLFIFSPQISVWFSKHISSGNYISLFILFLFCIYGGYFGAGLGIIMLGVLNIIGLHHLQQANGLKNLLLALLTVLGIGVYSSVGLIAWSPALIMMLGACVGGFFGGKLAKSISVESLRKIIILIAILLTAYYFYKT